MLAGLLLGALIVLRWFPETATARWLDRQVSEARTRLGQVERRHIVFLILMSAILIAGADLLAMGGPLDAGLVVVWDISTYLDIVLATATLAAFARGRAGLRLIAARLPRLLARRRAPRARPAARPERTSANDDDRPVARAA